MDIASAAVISCYGVEIPSRSYTDSLPLKTYFHHYRVVTQRCLSRSAFSRRVVWQWSNGFDFDSVWEKLTLGFKVYPFLRESTLSWFQDGGEKWQMVRTFSTRIFRFEIFDYLTKRSVYFEHFPVGRAKIVLPFTFWPKFPELDPRIVG